MIKKREQASQLRKELSRLAAQMPALVEPLLEPREVFKGNIYLSHRRCGKPSCRCARGELHRAWIAATAIDKKRTTRSVPVDKLERLQRMAHQYQEFREARVRLRKTIGELLVAVRALEETLAVDVFGPGYSKQEKRP